MNNHSLEKPFQYSLKHASEALGEVTGPFVAIISRADKNGRLKARIISTSTQRPFLEQIKRTM
jgi:hypothetical protein